MITNLPASSGTAVTSYDVNATDADVPANTLTYSINSEDCSFTPAIVSTTGMVSWTCGGTENCSVVVRATDNGTGSLFDQETLTVVVAVARRLGAQLCVPVARG
ncbi:MAG: cadherin repeat domain-containing protein [Ignavibacteriales bacterium]|nr:cadherin repeat domain-containing protein [Ignavibacteriales bacterium]